jgi:cation transport ATPase
VLFIVVMMTLAVWGGITAIVAAMAHTVATAVVLFNSARLFRYGETRADEAAAYIGHLAPEPAAA